MSIHSHKLYKAIWTIALGLLFSSCRAEDLISTSDGHYENSSTFDNSEFIGMQTFIPEFFPSKAYAVSLPLVTELNQIGLLRSIIEANGNVLLLVPAGTVEESPEVEEIKKSLGSLWSRVRLLTLAAGAISYWSRDFGPLSAVSNTTSEVRLLDFNAGSSSNADETMPQVLAAEWNLRRISIPLYNSQSNFMVNGFGDCFLTDAILDDNAQRQGDDLDLSEAEIRGFFEDFGGCKRVELFPTLPTRSPRQGHIDLWAKFLDNSRIIVAEISDETLDALEGNPAYSTAKNLQRFLDAQTRNLRGLGYTTYRIPMLAPYFSGNDLILRSYTDSLLVSQKALLPRFIQEDQEAALPYPDQHLNDDYEKIAEDVFRKAGFRVHFVNADQLAAHGGGIHRAVLQVGNRL